VELILASASPRRAALLVSAGIGYRAEPADVDETPHPGETPEGYVLRVARAKARTLVCRNSGTLVLGADTTVVVGDVILGKPADEPEAAAMLELLSGRRHDVLTGVALAGPDAEHSALARTRVRFLPLTDREVAWYIGTGEPFGKAGGYAIQGLASRFVDWIEGSYSNVVGLPVSLVYRMLQASGWPGDAGAAAGVETR
jgi:septum formation protein